ncbi:putative fatty acyl-CoA reductase CG8306 [Diabrotica virgifera virgifera]|uniref:Fatty acyl-CoA reductase n=1 Tax=Diabrotica virgifera virgifera TaxID=50390 RepID=A0ABM5KU50_DIAVI|nr:putative fatty acyl-CoA reductase CG8306 [Diabrotica virgifera virgifera]
MTIADLYKGNNVFITGGTGFMGQALIEKLLRSCPDIGTIYLLLRPKKDDTVRQRLEKLKQLPAFDVLRQENPEVLDKLKPISGDCGSVNLGLSESDRQLLIDNVNIIFHSAASVRFDDFLKYAILLNVRGTREVAQLALELKNISMLVHVSTTYCNCDRSLIEEKLYPSHGTWEEAIRLAEECDEQILNVLSQKYISPMPNTYTYAKQLGEQVINDMCNGKIPTLIVRPSIVTSAKDEPFPGWNTNFNGPVGMNVAGGKGLLRTVYGYKDAVIDMVPVDYNIKAIIIATDDYNQRNSLELQVYSLAQNDVLGMKQGEILDLGKRLLDDYPFLNILWYPSFTMTDCWYQYYFSVLLFHILPAVFFDVLLRIGKQKPMIVKLQRKIYIANMVVAPFMKNSYQIPNNKILQAIKNVKDEDSAFTLDVIYLNHEQQYEYFVNCRIGLTRCLLKDEKDIDFEKAKRVNYYYWIAHVTLKTVFYGLLVWIMFFKLDILTVLSNRFLKYFESL